MYVTAGCDKQTANPTIFRSSNNSPFAEHFTPVYLLCLCRIYYSTVPIYFNCYLFNNLTFCTKEIGLALEFAVFLSKTIVIMYTFLLCFYKKQKFLSATPPIKETVFCIFCFIFLLFILRLFSFFIICDIIKLR